MAFTRSPIFRLVVALTILTLPVAAYAADLVGKPSGGGDSIQWQLNVSGYDSVELTVLGPDGESWVKKFSAGRTPSFRVLDLGSDLADGVYNYQLRINPRVSADLRAKLDKARAAGDEAAARKLIREAGLVAPEQSGGFTVRNSSIVSPDEVENGSNATVSRTITTDAARTTPRLTPATEDQVIPDDLIVQGSACVGLDCVNNESFGFDTIRMKENNTRVKFEDTSVGTFPTTDWQLTANDSASGGQNKLSIEDVTGATVPFTVEGTALTNSVYVDSTGRIGFRTSTPVLDLHVSTGNTPALRLEQTSASGFTAQTWDVAGNEANFFVRDVTGGSRLPFRVRPGAPTSSIDISADGDIGIGTASPQVRLDVRGPSATADLFQAIGIDPTNGPSLNFGYSGATFGRGSGFFNVRPDASAAAPNPSLRFMVANTLRMFIDNEGFIAIGTTANPDAPIHYTNGGTQARLTTAGVWTDASSRAAKEHIENLSVDDAMKALHELQPVTYNYKVLPEDPKVGFIAEDVPDIVATPERQGLSALDIVAVVTKVVQEQQKTIDELNERIAQLEKQKNQ